MAIRLLSAVHIGMLFIVGCGQNATTEITPSPATLPTKSESKEVITKNQPVATKPQPPKPNPELEKYLKIFDSFLELLEKQIAMDDAIIDRRPAIDATKSYEESNQYLKQIPKAQHELVRILHEQFRILSEKDNDRLSAYILFEKQDQAGAGTRQAIEDRFLEIRESMRGVKIERLKIKMTIRDYRSKIIEEFNRRAQKSD